MSLICPSFPSHSSADPHVLREINKYCCHIVGPNTVFGAWSQNLSEDFFDWLRQNLFVPEIVDARYFLRECTYARLVGEAVPNSITCKHNEFIVLRSLPLHSIGHTGDCLLAWAQAGLVFVLEITKCSAESKIAIDSRHRDEVVGSLNSSLFFQVIRFVVKTQGYHPIS